jgi:hypothetical protein
MRSFLYLVLIVEIPLQILWGYQWIGQHGFWGGLWVWLSSVQGEPLTRAATVDFCFFIAVVGLWTLIDYPKSKLTLRYISWGVAFVLFPSIGMAIYLLWMHPERLAAKT